MMHCVGFEAKSIQRYILDSGRLRDMVGASALVDGLLGEPLDHALHTACEGVDVRFSRRAGGSFLAFFDEADHARRLRDVWSLIVPRYAPGMEYALAMAVGKDELEAATQALERLRANRFPAPRLPAITPLCRISPRTGEPAIKPDRGPDREWMDAATQRKRAVRHGGLEARFLGEGEQARFPRNMEEEFPLAGDNRYVGIVHADGNGLGEMLRRLQEQARKSPESYVRLYAEFSRHLEDATQRAAQRATREVLLPHAKDGMAPARPLVLGGDDLTIIVRGDLALDFARAFLDAFEDFTRSVCEFLRRKGVDWEPAHLTAGAGIAFVKINQPFALGYALAEELCGRAKRDSQRRHSAVAFHRVSTAFIPDLDWVWREEMSQPCEGGRLYATLGAYGIRENDALPALDSLRALAGLLADAGDRSGSGAMRRLLGLFGEGAGQAEAYYRRWREIVGDSGTGEPERLRLFDQRLRALLGEHEASIPARRVADNTWQTPLGDALALLAVEDRGVTG